MRKYRAGVIGCGVMGTRHAHAYNAVDGLKLVVVADVIADKAETLAQILCLECKYTDFTEMLAKEQLDLVSVCTPE